MPTKPQTLKPGNIPSRAHWGTPRLSARIYPDPISGRRSVLAPAVAVAIAPVLPQILSAIREQNGLLAQLIVEASALRAQIVDLRASMPRPASMI